MVYAQVSSRDDEEVDSCSSEQDDEIEMSNISGRRDVFRDEPNTGVSILPDLAFLEEQLLWGVWNRWEEPCLLSLGVTGILVAPLLLAWSLFVYHVFTGRFWSVWLFVLHLQIRLVVAVWYIKSITTIKFPYRTKLRSICSLLTVLEVILCGIVYPAIGHVVIEALFRDVDGDIVPEWKSEMRILRLFQVTGWLVVICRLTIGLVCISVRTAKYFSPAHREWRPVFMEQERLVDATHKNLHQGFSVSNLIVLVVHLVCILSAISHFGPWPLTTFPQECDPLDETECALPFPSFHHMRQDPTTPTGWRVDLKGLPPLRGGIPFHPQFLNEDLDGFSTMAPILFYIEGLKEAYEHNSNSGATLQGPEKIEYSVTQSSITLLLNVDERILVPHSAEIDYLDPERPLVMVIPARPLHHGTHYAIIVHKAMDRHGQLLPATPGMKDMFRAPESERRKRYAEKVLPALNEAADWIPSGSRSLSQDLEDIQLLFDFVTASSERQIGKTRAVRDATLAHVSQAQWQWKDHARILKEEESSCNVDGALIARTIHVEIDVPWFLKSTSSRYTSLDPRALGNLDKVRLGQAKAMIRIPCSIEKAAHGIDGGLKLRAIMEYGHGLFYHRGEVRDTFLSQMANKNGYVLFSMDWRGMSAFDLPVVIKTLIGSPDLFRSVRDNLIQGIANKFAFQHFCQHDMLAWLHVGGRPLPSLNQGRPTSLFYGISQGGILGGGYMALSGVTGLIDRGVLGVPGTPFALVMTRSLDFAGYDQLMLLNFYNNRHVRILLSLVQMGWDSVEASGLLAEPLLEPLPRVLLQAGLGDSVVPTSAAECLTRAMHGATLPSNPRAVFGVPTQRAASGRWFGPNVTLTEILYEKEYSSLPINDVQAPNNNVHLCVRLDSALIHQIEEFANTGNIEDVCGEDRCRRISADC
jgi:hypothetical protein